jgi:hypothetical protein
MVRSRRAPEQENFEIFMQGTERYVLSIALLFRIRDAVCRVLHVSARSGTSTHLTILAVGACPLMLNAMLYPFDLGCTGSAWVLLTNLAVLNCCLFLFPLTTWRALIGVSGDLNTMFGSSFNRSSMINWTWARLSLRVQLPLTIGGSAIGLVAAVVVRQAAEKHVSFCPSSYVSTTMAGGLGLNSCYWLWVVPLLIKQVGTLGDLKIRWHSPADTPALRKMSRILVHSSWRTGVGIALAISPLLYLSHVVVRHESIVPFNIFVAIAGLATLISIGATPQYWLSNVILESRERTLDRISIYVAQLGNPADMDSQNIEHLGQVLGVYQSVSDSRTSTISSDTLTQYIAAGLALVIPFVVQFVIHLLRH